MYINDAIYFENIYRPVEECAKTLHIKVNSSGDKQSTVFDKEITEYVTAYKKTAQYMTDSVFCLGNAPSVSVELELMNTGGILNQYIGSCFYIYETVEFWTTENGEETLNVYDIPIGYFYAYDKPEKYTEKLTLTLNDKMRETGIAYDSKLDYPTTLQAQLNEITSMTGLSFEAFPNEIDLAQPIGSYDNSFTIRQYLAWIAEANACNIWVNRNGKLEFKRLNGTVVDTTIPLDLLGDLTDEKVKYIISRVYFEDGLNAYEFGTEDNFTLHISADNPYIFNESTVQNIYNNVQNFTINSLGDLKLKGDPAIDLGDIVSLVDKDGVEKYRFMVLNIEETQNMSSIMQNLSGVIETENKSRIVDTSGFNSKIRSIKVNIDRNNQRIEIVAKEVDKNTQAISQINLDLDSIELTIKTNKEETDKELQNFYTKDQINQFNEELQGQIDQNITTYFEDGVPTLENYPANEWTTDGDKNAHLGDVYYDNATGKAYRFSTSNGAYTWALIQDSDITYLIEKTSQLVLDVDSITQRVSDVESYTQNSISNFEQQITTIDGKVDTANQNAQQAILEAGKAKTVSVTLSKENVSITTDADGNNGNYSSANTIVYVYYGTEDVTAKSSFTVTASQGVTGTWDTTTHTYQVANMTELNGTVTIEVQYLTFTVSKDFHISKVRKGVDGDQGNGIDTITNYYLASPLDTGVTTSTAGWTTTVQTVDATNKYLWNYEVTTFTSAQPYTSEPAIIGMYTEPSTQGINLLASEYVKVPHSNTDANTKNGYTVQTFGATFINNNSLLQMLKPNTKYTISYKYEIVSTLPEGYTFHAPAYFASLVSYNPTKTTTILSNTTAKENTEIFMTHGVGDVIDRKFVYTTPSDLTGYEILVYCINGVSPEDSTQHAVGKGRFFEIKFEEGEVSNPVYTPAIEDLQGKDGSNFKILTSDYRSSQKQLEAWAKPGYDAGNWVVASTDGLKVGDSVAIQCYDTTRNCYAYIYGTVTVVSSSTVFRMTSSGMTESGETGFGIVASVERTNFTEAQWNTYGTIGHEEWWLNTKSLRNGCRIGDLFTITGTATNTGRAHTLTYRATSDSGDLVGVCVSHVYAEKGSQGEQGEQGTQGINLLAKRTDYSFTAHGITIDYVDGVAHIYGTNTNHDASYGLRSWYNSFQSSTKHKFKINAGESYTLSTDVPLPTGLYLGWNGWNKDETWYMFEYLTGNGNRISVSKTIPEQQNENGAWDGFFGVDASCETVDVTFRIKVEKGIVENPVWTPAIEDLQGVGIDSIIEHYLVSENKTGITHSTAGWSTSIPTMTAEKKYLWNYETINYTDGTSENKEPKVIGAYGDTGNTYSLEASTLIMKKSDSSGSLTPKTVTFSSYYTNGENGSRTAYLGRFKIAESNDGINFTTKYTSTANESSKVYTPSSANIGFIKCFLYASGGTTTQLDSQTVTVLTDMEGIEIGGRNLLLNSSFHDNFDKWANTGFEITTKDGFKCSHASGEMGVQKHVSQDLGRLLPYIPNTAITFSAFVKVENLVKGSSNPTTCLYISRYDENITWVSETTLKTYYAHNFFGMPDGEWIKVYKTVSYPKSLGRVFFDVYARDFTGDIYVRDVKLEYATTPSDWTPAPEDFETQIEGVVQSLTTVTETVNSVSDRTGTLETTVDGITGQVTSLEETTREINTKVENFAVGGTNLLVNSNPVNNPDYGRYRYDTFIPSSTNMTITNVAINDPPIHGISVGFEISNASVQTGTAEVIYHPEFQNDIKYTFSVYARSVTGEGKLILRVGKTIWASSKEMSINSTDWKQYSFTISGHQENNTVHFIITGSSVGTFQLCGFQLEEGTIATSWSRNPYEALYDNGEIEKNITENYYTKTETESKIEAKSDSILLQVSETYATVSTVETAVTTAQGYTDTQLQSYSTTQEMNSAIQQSSTSILQSVSLEYVTTGKFESQVIGGRNLLLNSSFSENFNKWNNYNNGFEITIKDGFKCSHATGEMGVLKLLQQDLARILPYTPNTVMTLSAWVKLENIVMGTTNPTLNIAVSAYYNNNWLRPIFIDGDGWDLSDNVQGEWTKARLIVRYDSNIDRFACEIVARDFTGDYYIRDVMLEYSTTPSDWTPAPEDGTSYTDEKTKEVNAKFELYVDKEKLISYINASADVIELNSNRLIINSDNFKLAQDGTITAINGNFSGTITGSRLIFGNLETKYITLAVYGTTDSNNVFTPTGLGMAGNGGLYIRNRDDIVEIINYISSSPKDITANRFQLSTVNIKNSPTINAWNYHTDGKLANQFDMQSSYGANDTTRCWLGNYDNDGTCKNSLEFVSDPVNIQSITKMYNYQPEKVNNSNVAGNYIYLLSGTTSSSLQLINVSPNSNYSANLIRLYAYEASSTIYIYNNRPKSNVLSNEMQLSYGDQGTSIYINNTHHSTAGYGNRISMLSRPDKSTFFKIGNYQSVSGTEMNSITMEGSNGNNTSVNALTIKNSSRDGSFTRNTLIFQEGGIWIENFGAKDNLQGYFRILGDANITLYAQNSINLTSLNYKIIATAEYFEARVSHYASIRNKADTGYAPIYASAFSQQSSIRYKENVNSFDEVDSEMIYRLKPVTFDYKEDSSMNGKHRVGFIAEEAYDVFPQCVVTNEDGNPDGIDYSQLTPLAVKAIQDLKSEVEMLKSEISYLMNNMR